MAAIYDPVSIEAVLRAMGQAHDVPELAEARAPPGGDQGRFGAGSEAGRARRVPLRDWVGWMLPGR